MSDSMDARSAKYGTAQSSTVHSTAQQDMTANTYICIELLQACAQHIVGEAAMVHCDGVDGFSCHTISHGHQLQRQSIVWQLQRAYVLMDFATCVNNISENCFR